MGSVSPELISISYLPPKGDYENFVDESHYAEKLKEWGLSSKKQFFYKEKNLQYLVIIKGYEVYGKNEVLNTIIIEFQDGNLSCIHPAYLKEMQAASFGKGEYTDALDVSVSSDQYDNQTLKSPKEEKSNEPVKKKEKKEKPEKLTLPEEKVHFSATVKQFSLSWNNFNEENDEVIVLEKVIIQQDEPIEVGLAWCSHSKTLKKFELSTGDELEFDGKIVKKKLAKGKDVEEEYIVDAPVLYKINNPSKIKKG
ncbi:hypothetical protein [Cytobacillus dafuensis]|uniref:Uncharacterized protein n=1 Tax=Cytobacillus dafuensis TaxID=1742359 RepID=A0A5B8Z4H0_CYTDA|nr:hypothetical protein [Cytobacillus dafuensis]QED47788.1 hypothetical protein FSZ17_11310 [Cytobacillus dafuensis]